MYNIRYSKESINAIRAFVKNFHNKNILTISGGGILGEQDMIQTYLIGSVALREKIFEKCNQTFSAELIPKRVYGEDQIPCSILNIGNVRLFVSYLEDEVNKTRTITSIEFLRK